MRKSSLDPLLSTAALLLLTFVFGCAAVGETVFLEEFCSNRYAQLSPDNKRCDAYFLIGSKELGPKELEEECEKLSPMSVVRATNAKSLRHIICQYEQGGKCDGGSPEDIVFLVKSTCVEGFPLVDPATYDEAVEICRRKGASVLEPKSHVLASTIDLVARFGGALDSFWFGPNSTSANGKEYASVQYMQTRSLSSPSIFAERAETKEKHGVICSYDAEKIKEDPSEVVPGAHCSRDATFVDNECKCNEGFRSSGFGFKGQYCEPCEYNVKPHHINILVDFTWRAWNYDRKNPFEKEKYVLSWAMPHFFNPNSSMKWISYGNTDETDIFYSVDQYKFDFAQRWGGFIQRNSGEPPKRNNIDEAINRATAVCNDNKGKCITILMTSPGSYAIDCTNDECNNSSKRPGSDKTMNEIIREAADKLRATGSVMWVIDVRDRPRRNAFIEFTTDDNVHGNDLHRFSLRLESEQQCDHSFD